MLIQEHVVLGEITFTERMHFFTWGSVFMDYLFLSEAKVVKNVLISLAYYVFISCSDSHSGGTHSLQWIHWWANYVMLNFSKSVPMKKQTHLHLGWPEGKFIANFHFWVKYLFNKYLSWSTKITQTEIKIKLQRKINKKNKSSYNY